MSVGLDVTATTVAGDQGVVYIFKNSVAYALTYTYSILNGAIPALSFSLIDQANGTDYYQIYVLQTTSSGTATVGGNTADTFWSGFWIGA